MSLSAMGHIDNIDVDKIAAIVGAQQLHLTSELPCRWWQLLRPYIDGTAARRSATSMTRENIVNTKIQIPAPIRAALASVQPVVALESTVISHGLPYPHNLDLARAMEGEVRDQQAQPATVGVVAGVPTVGMSDADIERFAVAQGILKLSRRDIG